MTMLPTRPPDSSPPDESSRSFATAITQWLDAIYRRGQSERTLAVYQETIRHFWATCTAARRDLDSEPHVIAAIAQQWAWQRWGTSTRQVSPATAAMRLHVVSSFYRYAIRHRMGAITVNPIDLIDRPRVQPYAKARALPLEHVQQALAIVRAAADQGDLLALRDVAFLRVALTTGRRLAELAGLRRGHLAQTAAGAQMTLTIQWRTKGNNVFYDRLDPDVARDVQAWIETWYAQPLHAIADDAPVWGPPATPGRALTAQACGDIVRRHLHTHPNATRHTFAHAMRRAGARDSEIQQRLGHRSLATTGRYLAGLDSDTNPYAGTIAAWFS